MLLADPEHPSSFIALLHPRDIPTQEFPPSFNFLNGVRLGMAAVMSAERGKQELLMLLASPHWVSRAKAGYCISH